VVLQPLEIVEIHVSERNATKTTMEESQTVSVKEKKKNMEHFEALNTSLSMFSD